MTSATYQTDIVAWASEQAALLRAGRLDQLDLQHLADEIEDVGKSEQREFASRMAVLLAHLLKWQFQPEFRGASWQATIKTQRDRVAKRLQKTPSLQPLLNDEDWRMDVWADAVLLAAKETGIGFDRFPEQCVWSTVEILGDFMPE
jgi:hypothetical protein